MNVFAPVLLVSLVLGQAGGPPPSDSVDLGPEYVDGTYGISLQPPKGWLMDRQRISSDGGIRLLKLIEPGGSGITSSIELSMQMDASVRPIERRLARTVRAIEFDQSNAEILSQQVQTIAGKPGAVLSATMFDFGMKRFRMIAMIEARSRQYFELSYDGPAETKADAERLFYLVLGSLRLLVDPVKESEIEAALEAGKKWLQHLTGERIQKSINRLRFLEIRVKGEPFGLIRIEEAEHTWQKRRGVRIRERTWTFNPDGTATRAQTTMFVSDDLTSERWKESITTLIPSREGRPETMENTWEEGLRDGNVLLTNQTFSLSAPAKQNPPIRTPETYLPRALARMLPRLLGDLDKPRKIAFAAFDHERADLIVRTLDLKGAAPLPTGVTRGKTYRIEEREGVMAVPSVIYVDANGNLLYVERGDMTIKPAEMEELERPFGEKIRQAEAKIAAIEKAYRENQRRFGR